MRQHVTFYLLVVLASVALSQNTERSCPCTYGGIWLDIVAVIDNSQAMTTAGLAQVAATFATIVGQVNISQALGQYTRVSLISFSNSVTVVGNLTTYRNIDELIAAIYSISLSGVNALNIEAGLQAAGQVLALPRSDRANVKTVIVLFSSAYSSGGFTDPLPAANQLKEGGIPIITVAFTQADTGSQVNQIAALASPGFAVNSTDTNVIAEIFQNLCQVNCFCPANWFQMTDNYDRPTRKFGECLRYQDIEAAWTPAKFACQNELNGGFLYQEFSFQKHNFVQRLVNNTSTYNGNGQWHIGLSYDGGSNQYYWEGANGQVLLGSYQPWAPGYPQEAYGNAIGNADGQWRNNRDLTYVGRYVCQAATCDTDTYCAAV